MQKSVLGFVVVALLVACGKSSSGGGAAASAAVVDTSPPPAPPAKTPFQEIQEQPTFAAALAYAKPSMGDGSNQVDPGAVLFAAWAAKSMRWSDVAVKQDETTPALVKKDSDEERGKRLCFTGKIIQIAVEKTDFGKFTEGLLAVGYYDVTLFHFLNVGSSGSIVEGNDGVRFCGVVIGKYDYSNSGGGTGHAVQVVGMWDLPANKIVAGAPAAAVSPMLALPKTVAADPPPATPSVAAPAPTASPCGCQAGNLDCAMRCSTPRH